MRTIEVKANILRDKVKVGEIYPIGAISVSANADDEIKSSMSAEFYKDDITNWLNDEIEPICIIDGIEYSYGIYLPATITENYADGIQTVSVEAYDRCWLLQSHLTNSRIHLSAGTNYITAITSLLATCGISLINSVPTSLTLATDREDWDLGTDYLTIVNALLKEINYFDVYFDRYGYAVLKPKAYEQYATRTYDYHTIESLLVDNTSLEMDLFDAPNSFICMCDNPDNRDVALIATAENTNPISPKSIPRRGRRIYKYVKVDNISNQSALNDYANLLCTESMFMGQVINIETAIQTDPEINKTVGISHDYIEGLCLEKSWSASLEVGGSMTHSLQRMMIG